MKTVRCMAGNRSVIFCLPIGSVRLPITSLLTLDRTQTPNGARSRGLQTDFLLKQAFIEKR